uniref:WD40 repeat domain-containing protein n=1 Tax=Nitrosomonas sp. TaxID=42353 RepID=UPI002604D57A
VNSAAFSMDGTRVVTASDDGAAQIWDAQSGQALGEAMRHQGKVISAGFSADGTRVVTASWVKTARIWDVLPVLSDPHNLLAELAEAVAGLKLGEYGAIETLDDQIERLNQLRQRTAHVRLGEPTAESFVRWFLSDPWTRTISPLSRTTVPEYIQREIAAGRREQVAREFPGHPLLLPSADLN